MPIKIATVQTGLEQSIQRAVRNVNARGGLNVAINDRQFTGPLGKITGSVSEFNKSLEASNARVIAFGASVGIIQGVQKALAGMVTSAIDVERQMTEINVVMGLTNEQLNKFSSDLFAVAKNTAQSFSTVASAATELARQGLTMEETLKRTNDALILTRLTGLDAASAVSGLTAALNTFSSAGLDSTKILSKMAAVDVQFAVSTEDLIDAVSRAGAVANDAGVSFDQLLGAVTAAQQMTARGGKVIGNSFKTIFTRVQRSSTINRLEELGIAVRDVAGNTLPAITVLENLAKTYDTLADTTKAAVAEQVGGVFQINILKAAIKDLADENSILARATEIASQATDEAYKKNEILNRSLAALTSQTSTSIKELASILGEITFADGVEDGLNIIKQSIEEFSGFLTQEQGESAAADFTKGLLQGIGKALTGPGVLIASALLIKLFGKTLAFLKGSAGELLGVVSAAKKQKQIQESIVTVLGENSQLQKRILSQEGNRAAQEKTILSILQAQSREQQKIAAAARVIAPGIAKAGYGPSLTKTRSSGHIPNYANPSSEEKIMESQGAIQAGYRPGKIKSMKMPGLGRVVYNTAEQVKSFPGMSQPAIMPPKASKAGKKYEKKFKKVHGFNPYANTGHVPNYGVSSHIKNIIWGSMTLGKRSNPFEGLKSSKNVNKEVQEFEINREMWRSLSQSSYFKYKKANQKSIEKKLLTDGGLNKAKNLRFGELPRDMYQKAVSIYYGKNSKFQPSGSAIPPEIFPTAFVNRSMRSKLGLNDSTGANSGFVPNFMPLRINAKSIKSMTSRAKIREDNYDGGTIGMSKLLEILNGRLFTSIRYRTKRSDEGYEDLFLSGARSGVHQYKKGAPPPRGYSSWKELDEATGTTVVHANSAGIGEEGYRRLKLKKIESVVSRGKHYKIDPDMAASGHIPNYEFDKNKFGPYVVGKEVLNIGKERLRGTANFGLKGLESIYNIGKSTLGGINNMMLSNPKGAGLMGLGATAAFSMLPGPAAGILTAAMATMHGLASAAEYGPSNPDPEGQRKAEEERIKNLKGLNRFGPYAALRSLTDMGVSGARKTGSSIIGAGKSLFQSGVGAIKSINTSMVRDPRGFLAGMAPIGAIGGAFATLPPVLATFLSAGIAGASAIAGAGKQYGQMQERIKATRAATLNAQATEQMIAKGEKGIINPAILAKSIGKVRAGQLPKEFQEKAISMMRKGGNRGSYITRAMRKILGIKSEGFVPNLAKPGMTLTPKAPSTLWATHPTFNIDSIRKHGIKTFPGMLSKYQSRSEEIRRLEKMDQHGMLSPREKTQLDFMKQQEGHIFGWGTKPQAHVMGFQRAFKDKFERNLKVPMEELSSLYNVVKFRVDPKKWIRDDLDPTYNNAWRSRQDVSPEDIISIKPIDQVLAKETLKINPTAAGAILPRGFVPNYARRVPSVIKAEEIKGYGGAPSQIKFSSNVGDKPFTESMAIIIPDPKNSLKPGLQVVNTLESNPNLRGKGYGRELYEYMADYAKKKGYAGLYGDMGTSPSVMRVVDSIAKKGKFNVEKNSDLKFFKDDFDTTGMYASDSWTYKLSNEGLVPNYSISRTMARLQDSATYARGKLTPVQSRSQGKLKDFILRRAKLSSEAREFEPPKFDLTLARNGKPIEYLDNSTASRARAAVITSDGKTHLGYWHDNIREDLKRRKVNLRGSKDLELTWASQGLIPNYKNSKQLKIYNNDGLIPNYALMGAPVGIDYLSGLSGINPQVYSDSIIDKAESLKDEQKRTQSLNEISKRPDIAVKALNYLDNRGLERVKNALSADNALRGSDWTYVKSGVGKATSADVSKDLSKIPAREIFNYLTGKTDRIQGSVPGHFIRLLDHSDRRMQARDMIGSSPTVTKIIKQQISAIKKSPKRRAAVMDEVLNKDVLKLGFDPKRGQSMAQRRSDELRQKSGIGGILAGISRSSSPLKQSSPFGLGKFGEQSLRETLSDPKVKAFQETIKISQSASQTKSVTKGLGKKVQDFQQNLSMTEKYGPNWKMWDQYQQNISQKKMRPIDARAAVKGVHMPFFMEEDLNKKIKNVSSLYRRRGFNLGLNKGLIPSYEQKQFVPNLAAPNFLMKSLSKKWKDVKKKAISYGAYKGQRTNSMPKYSYMQHQGDSRKKIITRTSDGQETVNYANKGDYIISGPSKEKYVCRQKDFSSKYVKNSNGSIEPKQENRQAATVEAKDLIDPKTQSSILTIPAPWGGVMKIRPGDSVINDPGGPYRVAQKEFKKTYTTAPKGLIPNYMPRIYAPTSPMNIARALKFGGRTALNLDVGGGKRLKDFWHSSTPALATSTELDSIRTVIFQKLLKKKDPEFLAKVNEKMATIGTPETWGIRSDGNVLKGMLDDLNRKRADIRGVPLSKLPERRTLRFEKTLNEGLVPNYALKRLKTIAQAVGMFKKDTGSFSALSGKNFWSRRANAIKLRESNYEEVRQFVNSRSFRSLDSKEQKKVVKDLKNQSEELNMNDVTRPYFKYDDPNFQGRILSSKGLIPNYNLANRKVFYLKDIEVIRNPNVKDLRSLRKDFEKEYPLSSWSGGDPKTRFTIDTDGNRYIWPSHAGMHSYVEPLLQRNIKKDVSQTFSSSHKYNTGFVPNYTKLMSGQAQSILQKSPQYSGAVLDAVKREASFGVTPKVVAAPSLRSSSNPGLAVVNYEQEGGSLSKARMLHGGLNPKQKSSVPNYALTGSDVLNIQYGADQSKKMLGLTAMENSFYKAKDAIDLFSVGAGKGRKALEKIAIDYANSSNIAKEANLRHASAMGQLEKESPSRQSFARQFFRKEAIQDIASGGGRDALLAQKLAKSGDFEGKMLEQKAIAERDNNKEMVKSLNRLDGNIEKGAMQMMNQPRTVATTLERNLKRDMIDMKRLSKFTGDEGFSKQKAQQFFARQFLQERGINVQDRQQANSIIAAMGKQGQKELSKFMDKQGVKSSNAQLARAGFASGELRSLTSTQSSSFVQNFKKLEQKLTSTSARDRIMGSRSVIADLRKEALKIGKDNAAVTTLNQRIDDFKKSVNDSAKASNQINRQNDARNRISSAGGGIGGLGNRLMGSLQMGAAGGRNFAPGLGGSVAGTLGRAGGFIGSKTKEFAGRGFGGFGGQVGLGLSFIAPMAAGVIQDPRSRLDRASFKDGAFEVEGTQGLGDRDVMSSVLMGTGMGAIFGPAGALVGAVGGFVSAMRKTTLTLEEQVQLREKEISLIGQNLQAIGSVQNLTNARVKAFQTGNQDEVNRIDAAINSTLATINDKEILDKASDAAGDVNAMSNVEKILQDRMTIATSGQNFAMAVKNNNTKNAGVALGSIIAQNIRNGVVDSDVAKQALKNITSSVEQKRASGQLGSVEEMSRLRRTAAGEGDLLTGRTVGGTALGVGAGLSALALLAAAPFTGGLSLTGIPAVMGAAAIGGGAGYYMGREFDQENAQEDLDRMDELGVREIQQLERLVEAGAMTEKTLEFLIAAFQKGELGIDQIAAEALKSVAQFEKIERNSARTANQLFNLDQKFKIAIRNLTKSMEIDKIETKSSIDRQSVVANFASQFMDPQKSADFMGTQQTSILEKEVALTLRQFTRESSAMMMKDIKQRGKTLNLMPSQVESLINLVEKEGNPGVQRMINKREVEGKYQLKLDQEDISFILKTAGLGADGSGVAGISDTRKLSSVLGTSDKTQQLGIIGDLQQNLNEVRKTGTLDVRFEKELTDENARILQELLDDRAVQKEILQAQIQAQKEALEMQIKQNTIQTEIQTNLEAIRIRASNRAQQRDIDMMDQQMSTQQSISRLEFSRSDKFRGFTSDEQENKRQADIRKKIFNEEFKLQKQQDLNSFKMEAARLLSEKTLVDSLNNLSSVIKEEMGSNEESPSSNQPSLSSQAKDSSKTTTRERGAAAKQWLDNFAKTGQDMMDPSKTGTTERGAAAKQWLDNFAKTGQDMSDSPKTVNPTRGSAAKQWLNNFAKTQQQNVQPQNAAKNLMQNSGASTSTNIKPAPPFVPENETNKAIQRQILQRTDKKKDLTSQLRIAEKNISRISSARDLSSKQIIPLSEALDALTPLKFSDGTEIESNLGKAERILKDAGHGGRLTTLKKDIEGRSGLRAFSARVSQGGDQGVYESELRQRLSAEVTRKTNVFKQRQESMQAFVQQRQELIRQIEEENQAIEELESQKIETVNELPSSIEKQKINLEKFSLRKTEIAMLNIDDAKSLDSASQSLDSILQEAKNNNASEGLIATIQSMKLLVEKTKKGQQAIAESFKLQEAQRNVDDFLGTLNFNNYAGSSLDQFRDLETNFDVRAQAGANAFQNAVNQVQREKSYDVVMQDPTATNLEKAEARLAKNAVTFGTKEQRDRMSSFIDQRAQKVSQLADANFNKDEAQILTLEAELTELNDNMEKLALSMERSVSRDQPAFKSFSSDFKDGLQAGFADVEARSEGIYSRLGRDLPNAFHQGMVDAMQAAIMQSENMGDVLNNIGLSFLSIIQRAFLESAASRMMGIFGFNSGGYVTGGSGVKDDVPAMLTGGEYVMRRSAVEKYGTHFMHNLNQGMVPGFNEGGMVGLDIKGPRAAVREEYEDKNDYGSVTRYRVKRAERGIDQRLSGYAIANDREIQKYFRDQENQFNEDLGTKRQEEYRKNYEKAVKERERKMEQQKKENNKKMWKNMLLGIAGAALLSYGLGKAGKWWKGTKMGQDRFKSGAQKQMKKDGFVTVKGSNSFKDMSPADEFQAKAFYNRMNQAEGPIVTSNELNKAGIPAKVGPQKIKWEGNEGGQVPSLLNAGEYVVRPEAVQAYGTSMLNRINSGSAGSYSGESAGTKITHGDVNITINVAGEGTASSSSQMGDREFASKVKGAVLNVIKNEKRQGGALR